LCKTLRHWRESANFTQRDLAERLGKPRSFVYKVETANRRIDPIEFAAWCRCCSVKADEAMGVLQITN